MVLILVDCDRRQLSDYRADDGKGKASKDPC